MNSISKLTNEIIDYGKLIIVAAIMIYVVYIVIKTLIGDLPANVSVVLLGLASIFVYATNKKIRDSIDTWLRK